MADTRVHTGVRCVPVPMFATGGAPVVVGSTIPAHTSATADTDYQVALAEGGFLVVRGNVLVAWANVADPTLAAFTATGEPADAAVITAATDGPDHAQVADRLRDYAAGLDRARCTAGDTTTSGQAFAAQVMGYRAALLGIPHHCPVCEQLRVDARPPDEFTRRDHHHRRRELIGPVRLARV